MKIAFLLCAILAAFASVGCNSRRGSPTSLVRAAIPQGATAPAPEAIAITAIQETAAWLDGPSDFPGLLFVAPTSAIDAGKLPTFNRPNLTYPQAPMAWRQFPLPPPALAKIAAAMLADPRFSHPQLAPEAALSVRVMRYENGRPVFAEVFVSQADAFAFAAMVTDSCIGTDALRAALQWEMNL